MQKFAELTGRPQDKAYYAELGENIKNGFNRRFYRSGTLLRQWGTHIQPVAGSVPEWCRRKNCPA